MINTYMHLLVDVARRYKRETVTPEDVLEALNEYPRDQIQSAVLTLIALKQPMEDVSLCAYNAMFNEPEFEDGERLCQ